MADEYNHNITIGKRLSSFKKDSWKGKGEKGGADVPRWLDISVNS
jgi:hypothetical protein